MKRSFILLLLWLGHVIPAHALCQPGFSVCNAPAATFMPAEIPQQDKMTLILPSKSRFALEQTITPDSHKLDLRPTWRLNDDTRLSLKAKKDRIELRLKMQW